MYHKKPYTDVDLRKHAYVIGMSAAALNFGDMDGNSTSGFSGTLELDACFQTRHDIVRRVWDLFETVPYYRMQPAEDLVSSGDRPMPRRPSPTRCDGSRRTAIAT